MKKILLIATGGTIACKMEQDGLTPVLSSEELLSYLPSAKNIADVETLNLFNLDSSNICPDHWLKMARAVEENYDTYDGFVICHGTDTLAFTAAALSYLIQGGQKPIVVTGAQKPINTDISDAKQNLSDSLFYACQGLGGVSVVFDGKVIAGTRAKKTHTKSYHAFSSINFPYLALFQGSRLVRFFEEHNAPRPVFYHTLDQKVGLFKVLPNFDEQLLYYLLEKNDAVIIESFGSGGLPERGEDMLHRLREYTERGKFIVMTTQVQSEGSDMSVYRVGSRLKESCGIIECFDMTPESVLAKLMWILSVASDRSERIRLFYGSVNHDICFSDGV